jgi:hypothetical protein
MSAPNVWVLSLARPLSWLVANGLPVDAHAPEGQSFHWTAPRSAVFERPPRVGDLILIHTSSGKGSQDAHALLPVVCRRAGLTPPEVVEKGLVIGIARLSVAVLGGATLQGQPAPEWHFELDHARPVEPFAADDTGRTTLGGGLWWPTADDVARALRRALPSGDPLAIRGAA